MLPCAADEWHVVHAGDISSIQRSSPGDSSPSWQCSFLRRTMNSLIRLTLAVLSLSTLVSASCGLQDNRAAQSNGYTHHGAAASHQSIMFRVGLASSDIPGLETRLLSISHPESSECSQWLSAGKVSSSSFHPSSWSRQRRLRRTCIARRSPRRRSPFRPHLQSHPHADLSFAGAAAALCAS
jgi:hypothetical protein